MFGRHTREILDKKTAPLNKFFNVPSREQPVDISPQPDNKEEFRAETRTATHPGSCHPLASLSNCADAHQYQLHQLGCGPQRYSLEKIEQKVKAITQTFHLLFTGGWEMSKITSHYTSQYFSFRDSINSYKMEYAIARRILHFTSVFLQIKCGNGFYRPTFFTIKFLATDSYHNAPC